MDVIDAVDVIDVRDVDRLLHEGWQDGQSVGVIVDNYVSILAREHWWRRIFFI